MTASGDDMNMSNTSGQQEHPEQNRHGFARYYSTVDVWGIAFGCMVGWGAFVMPGTTFLPIAGPLGTLIAMAISVAIVLIIGMNYAWLMAHRPGTGGAYSYTKEAYGRDHAFLCAWFLCLAYLTIVFLNASSLFTVLRTMFDQVLSTGWHYQIAGTDIYLSGVVISVIALAAVGLLFILATPALQRIHTMLSVILLAGSVVVTVLCLPHVHLGDLAGAFGTQGVRPAYAIYTIVLLAPWAFVGFDVIAFETSHFKFKIGKTKRIIILSIIFAGFVYAAMSVVSITAVPDGYASWQEYLANLGNLSGVESVPTFYAARAIIGAPGLAILGITALAAILTGIIGAYRATTRVLSTMSEDHIISRKFSITKYSILFIMIISIVISLLGRNALEWFVELTSFGALVGFGYTSASAWKIAKLENNRRIVITGMIGTIITIAFVLVHLIPRLTALEAMGAHSFFLLSLWCLLGFIFYWRTVNHGTLSEYSGLSLSGVVMFALLLYSILMWFAKCLVKAESIEQMHRMLIGYGIILLIIVFVGLTVMLYVQNLLRKKHQEVEREKIRAVESSLAKSRFLFNMSHDIRTPMNAIIGYTDLARKENEVPVVEDYLGKINASGKHLLALINDILEMSRIESGTMTLNIEAIDLVGLMDGVRDLFTAQMDQKQIDFAVNTQQIRNRYVWADPNNLNRILLNIVSNAWKFTPEGGSVSVALWEIRNTDSDRCTYEFRIRDSGIGMSSEFAEKMFTAFERERTSTDSGIEGTGLGLSITKSIVDLMEGTIDVITSPGAGTEFVVRISFRIADETDVMTAGNAGTDQAENGSAEERISLAGKRVLLVEDNAVNREIAMMILTQEGFEIETTENGQIALDLVRDSEPGYYDLILMDIQMPVMDGYTSTKEIRALPDPVLSAIPIIAMTANAFKEDEIAAEEAGMQGHIAKPIDIPKMMQTIREVMAGKEAEHGK